MESVSGQLCRDSSASLPAIQNIFIHGSNGLRTLRIATLPWPHVRVLALIFYFDHSRVMS